jgi:5-dehydro-2-deoxygluconokinase
MTRLFDILSIGRSSIDLYSNDVGAQFTEISSFAAYVGGCPTNISVGASRLGLRSALLTAVGEDPVGDFVLNFLDNEGVDTRFIPRKPGFRTSAVLLGIVPPDQFPLTFYREHCADNELTIADVLAAPVDDSKLLLINGTALSKDPCRTSTIYAAECARKAGARVILDLDFRPDQWLDVLGFGVAIRSILRLVDIVLGTEDEINAALMREAGQMNLSGSQISDARVQGDVERSIRRIMDMGPKTLFEKRGAQGSRVHAASVGGQPEVIDIPGFPVKVQNILGAGDAYASGVIYGLVQGWDWYKSARFGNACGAIVVTRHGSSAAMPTLPEVTDFIDKHTGV